MVRHGVEQGPPLTRRRIVVLALVALAALPPISLAGPQDRTRYELTRHLVLFHTVRLENGLFDRAYYDGHTYSDKAPGMSFFAIPWFELERVGGIAKAPAQFDLEGDPSLWLMRVLTSGLLFLAGVAVVAMLADRIVPGSGDVTAVLFGTATLAAPLAPTFFEHDAAGAFAIGSFALAWLGRRRPALAAAGLLAGIAVLFDYQTSVAAVCVAAYAVWRHRLRSLWLFLGAIPAVLALGAYDWVSFGSPFHVSYRYVYNSYTEQQRSGLFGIGRPSLHGLAVVLGGSRGLLVWSPICLVAAAGLWLLWRRGLRAEAVLCAVVVAGFLVVDAGYFLPYGGGSPGPRFFAPALPFLALGIPPMLERFRGLVLVVGAVSVFTMSVMAMSWGVRMASNAYIPGRNDVMSSIWSLAGLNRDYAAVAVLTAALAGLGVAAWQRRPV